MSVEKQSLNQDLKKLLDYASERREYCAEFRQSKFDGTFQNTLATYEPSSGTAHGTTNTFEIPMLFTRCETLLAHQLAEFYGYKDSPLIPYGDVYATHQKSENISMLWEYRQRQMKFLNQMTPFFREANLLGTSVASLTWDVKVDYVYKKRQRKLLGFSFGPRFSEREATIVYNGPKLTVLDVMNFYADPDAVSCDIQECLDCGYDRWMTQAEIETLYHRGFYGEGVKLIDWDKVGGRTDATGASESDKRASTLGLQPSANSRGQVKKIRVSDWWGRHRLKNMEMDIPTVVTIADPGRQNILLRPHKKYPFKGNYPYEHGKKPFVAMNYLTRDFCFWGRGLGEIIESTNELYQTYSQNRLSNLNLLQNRMAAYVDGAIEGDVKAQLVSRPLGTIRVREGSKISDVLSFLEFPNVLADVQEILMELRSFLDELTGVDAIMSQGASVPGAKTPISAMEAAIRQKMSGQKFRFLVNSMMAQGPAEIANMELELERQYNKESTEFNYLRQDTGQERPEPKFFSISPEDLDGKYNYYYVGDPLRLSSELEKNTKLAALGVILGPIFTMQGATPMGVIDVFNTAKALFKLADIPWQECMIPESEALSQIAESFARKAAMESAEMAAGMMAGQMPPGNNGGNGKIKGNAPEQAGSLQPPTLSSSSTEPTIQPPPLPGVAAPVRNPPAQAEGGVMLQ